MPEWMKLFFFPVLYSPPSGGAKLELILCGGQQAYWVPGILTYSYHRRFIWHACTLCDFFFVLILFVCFINAALDCGRENALLCVAATGKGFVSAPQRKQFMR